MFDADFLGFFRFDEGGDVDESFGRGGAVVFDFFDRKVGVRGDADCRIVARGVDVDYDEDGIGDVAAEEFVDAQV